MWHFRSNSKLEIWLGESPKANQLFIMSNVISIQIWLKFTQTQNVPLLFGKGSEVGGGGGIGFFPIIPGHFYNLFAKLQLFIHACIAI